MCEGNCTCKSKDELKNKHFTAGIGYVLALLKNVWNEDSLVEYIIKESGIKKEDFKKYCDEYDYNFIKGVF